MKGWYLNLSIKIDCLKIEGLYPFYVRMFVLKKFVGHCGIIKPGSLTNGKLETLSIDGTFINCTKWLTLLSTLPQSSGTVTLLEIEL